MAKTQDVAAAAAEAIATAQATVALTVAGGPGAELPEVMFDRLSVERRVLGHITDETDQSWIGPRNTLAALTQALMTDRHTTAPVVPGHPRLEIEDASVAQVAQQILEHLDRLVDAGLVVQRKDDSYALTEAGHQELAN